MSRWVLVGLLLASANVVHAENALGTRSLPGHDRTSAIVGGSNVPPGKWPDTVAVLGDSGGCTGTLIAPDVVLTAGHCAEIQPSVVVANTIDYTSGGTTVGVTRTIAHPSWQSTYDVAVVLLAQPITSVAPRAVGTDCTFRAFAASTQVHLVGFGATDVQGTAANSLLKEAMTAVVDPTCETSGSGCNPSVAPGGEFIAGGSGTADSCFGDSGGPVYLDTPRGPVVIGAVSRGVEYATTPCGGGGIYVRTDKIVEWIEQTAGKAIEKDTCAVGPDDDGSGTGTGSGTGDPGGQPGDPDQLSGDIIGGCSTSSGGRAGVLVLVALALAGRRRRAMAKPAEDPSTWPRWR